MRVYYPLIFLSLLFLINGFFIDVGFRMIPLYFYCVPLFLVILLTNSLRIHRLSFFEIALFIFYIYAISTSLYTMSHELSLRFILGLAVVSICYFTFKSIAVRVDSYTNVLRFSLRLFIVLSFSYYIFGLSTINLGSEHSDFFGATVEKGIPRMIGLNNDPNLCAVALLFPLFFFCFDKSKFSRAFFLLSLFCLLATLSRGGIIAGFVGLLAIFFMVSPKIKFYYFTTFIILIFAGFVVYSFFSDTLGLLIEKRITGLSSGGGRFEVWYNALTLFDSKPMFGFGIFTFRHVSELNFGIAKFAHNTYLEILVETGWLGLLLFFIFCILVLSNSFFLAMRSVEHRYLFPLTLSFLFSMLSLSMYINPIFIFIVLLNSVSIYHVSRKISVN